MPQSKISSVTSTDANAATKPKRRYRTIEQWREIVDDFHRGSLTRSEFCKQHGIATSGLYNWQRRFEQERASRRVDEGTFVELQAPVVPSHGASQPWDVELELGQGRVLRVRIA